MKIKVYEIVSLWNGLQSIYNQNDSLNGAFDYIMQEYNLPILKKEVQRLQSAGDGVFAEIKDKEIDLPLQTITPDMLTAKMPKGLYKHIKPIIEGEVNVEGYESRVEGLLSEVSENGKVEDES